MLIEFKEATRVSAVRFAGSVRLRVWGMFLFHFCVPIKNPPRVPGTVYMAGFE
ncbi:MAG: hypothetical protein LBG96_14690 [Tannerella sp.]|jgi:hypothetical protein|nr:hypothetical protein [Tannerella sp.]